MISILVPVYNTKKQFLEDCINSCLKQSFKEFEIILIDNGSVLQETIDTLEKFSKLEKISIYKCDRQAGKKNLSIALNFGLSKCKYNLINELN
jgi:glycosyltransferase involved in cell wall biosynthesis